MDSPTIFGANNRPVSEADKAGAQVQPAPRKGPMNRYRGYYLMMPQQMNRDLEQAHTFLAAVERAPVDFGDFLLLLIMQGAQVYVTHQMAEVEAQQAIERQGEKLRAQKVLEDPEATPEAKKAASDYLAALIQQENEEAEVKPAPVDEREQKPGDAFVDPTASAAEAQAAEAQGKDLIAEALASTPEPGA